MKRIPINKPSITELEINYVNDAIANGWGENCYTYIQRFENQFCSYLNSSYGLATSSCTGAIHLALMAAGVTKEHEVIVPEITWIASVEPVLYIGAKPVFVDVLETSWCISAAAFEAAITPRTKAVILVHVYGNMCNMADIMAIAKKHNIIVIEDAAEALGSEYRGQKAGSIADIGVFSFHGTKTISTGEGGILVTNNESIYEKAKILNDHGRNSKDPENKMFWMRDYGYKYKMSNLQAAMGCAQIERVNELVEKKRQIYYWYREILAGQPISLNPDGGDLLNSFWLPTVVVQKDVSFNREAFFEKCQTNNVDCRPFFRPLSSLPMFESVTENTVAYDISYRSFNLPSFHDATKNQINFVAQLFISSL